MDSSTHQECLEITETLGGHQRVAKLTGSIATERFAGPQIRKFFKEDPAGYRNTAHIALISSFITSILTGSLAPLDGGDGFGTNLADIGYGRWSKEALDAAAPDLGSRLPPLMTKDGLIGSVGPRSA
jgi:xylulokinase